MPLAASRFGATILSSVIQGRIVHLTVPLADPQGRAAKFRPYIIITENASIDPNGSLDVVALTTTYDYPLPEDHVELPWGRGCFTKLTERSAAVCSWHYRIPFSWIKNGKTGLADGEYIDVITEKVERFSSQPIRTFTESD